MNVDNSSGEWFCVARSFVHSQPQKLFKAKNITIIKMLYVGDVDASIVI